MKIIYYKNFKIISKNYKKIKKILNIEEIKNNNKFLKKLTQEYKKLKKIDFLINN
ncbi:MAG: hypothetical protein ACM66E_00485 [Enterobacteriaceae bacterium]